MACLILSRPCFALPPAESPSTKKISDLAGSFSEQSANLPGKAILSSALFLLVSSLAFLAASLAREALKHLSTMILASLGCSSKKAMRFSLVDVSTKPLISVFPSFVFVCPSNCGSVSLTEIMAVKPSLTSSPARESSLSFKILFFLEYSLKTLVSAD